MKELLDEIQKHPELASLGTKEELKIYLREEIRELDLSDNWDILKTKKWEDTNPHNILLWYLVGLAPMPKELKHSWTEGDSPDIDMDYEPDRRDDIKQMLRDKFGDKYCMEVSTLGGMHVKGAIQDLARIAGIPPQEVFKVTTTIKYNVNNDEENRLEWIVENNPTVRKFLAQNLKVAEWTEKMQEVKRSIGKHASAFIISSVPINEHVPVVLSKDKKILTGYSESSGIKALQGVGLIKQDFLGLKNLTIIRETLEMVKERSGETIDIESLDLNDPDVYKLLRNGYNSGIFQLEGGLPSGIIKTIQPTEFRDLAALNSLIRPACLSIKAHEPYRDHKNGRFNREEYPVWKDLKGKVSEFTYDMLDNTYGIILFQDQVMAMLAEFCGVDLDETNKMRKIISIPAAKKQPEHFAYIKTQKKKWMDYGGKKIGLELAEQWWDTAVGSLSYGFNKPHCYAYSLIAFRQLYLKAKYPTEFFAALLKSTVAEAGTTGRSDLMRYVVEAKHLGVDVESPHINESKKNLSYSDDGKKIYIGFSQVKGIGEAAAKDIIKRKPYTSFEQFLDIHKKGSVKDNDKPWGRSGVNKTAIEALIYTNAFRDWKTREELIVEYSRHLLPKKRKNEDIEIPSHFDILRKERDLLTIVLSESNIIDLPYGFLSITKALDTGKSRVCKIKGIIDKISYHKSKAGNQYAKMVINDLENSAIILVWKNFHGKLKTFSEGEIAQLKIKHLDGDTFSLMGMEKIDD